MCGYKDCKEAGMLKILYRLKAEKSGVVVPLLVVSGPYCNHHVSLMIHLLEADEDEILMKNLIAHISKGGYKIDVANIEWCLADPTFDPRVDIPNATATNEEHERVMRLARNACNN